MPADATVRDNADKHRYEIVEGDELAAFVDYHLHDNVIAFLHTETLSGFEGKGIASRLIAATLDDARARGFTVQPFCPFVRAFIDKHRDGYVDLVAPGERARFDLA